MWKNPQVDWIGTENHGISNDFDYWQFETEISDPEKTKFDQIKATASKNPLPSRKQSTKWIGTNGGRPKSMDLTLVKSKNPDVETGLSNNVIYSILDDQRGNLWLSSPTKESTKSGLQWRKLDGAFSDHSINSNYDDLATEFNTGAYFKKE